MSGITVGDNLIHFQVLGRGRPVILIHGWLGSWRYWAPLMQQLQLKYRVYALDLYGFGDSSKNRRSYTLAGQLQLLDNFMSQLGIEKAALIGHSLGALVACEFAARPENHGRIPRLLLVSPPIFDPGDLNTRGKRGLFAENNAEPGTPRRHPAIRPIGHTPPFLTVPSATAAMRAALEEASPTRPDGEASAAPRVNAPPPRPARPRHNVLLERFGSFQLEDMLAKCFRRSEPEYEKFRVDIARTDAAAAAMSMREYDAGRMVDVLRALSMPTVMVHGMEDALLPVPGETLWHFLTDDREELALPIPLHGVRHFPMLEHEGFMRLVMNFLDTPDVSRLEIKERWRRRTR